MQVITIDENDVPSMTSQAIYNLVQNGGRVVLNYNGQIYSLASCEEGSAYFNYYDEMHAMRCIEIYNNQFIDHGVLQPVNENWVLDQLGPISEALDATIALQEEVIALQRVLTGENITIASEELHNYAQSLIEGG